MAEKIFEQQQRQQWQSKILNQNYLMRGVHVKSWTFFLFDSHRITGLFLQGASHRGFSPERQPPGIMRRPSMVRTLH